MDQLCTWSVQGPFMEQLLDTWNEIKNQPHDLRNESVERADHGRPEPRAAGPAGHPGLVQRLPSLE